MRNFDYNRIRLLIKHSLTIMLLTLITLLQSNAQTGIIKGSVKSGNYEGLPGVNISLKGTKMGTTSDSKGDFTIQAKPEDILVFTMVGFQTREVNVGTRTSIDVVLNEETKSLEEVVVVGYGTQKRKDLTGSVVSIKSTALREVPAANAIQALQGRLAGVDIARNGTAPGTGGQIRIRGNRSLNAGNDPLIVIDGIPFGGSINDINTDDIETIDVLKDASATAIYGSRASNGVIIITTKRGKVGKPTLTYNAYYGTSEIIGQYDMLTGPEFKTFRDLANKNGTATPAQFSPMELAGIAAGTSTNWQDLLYTKGMITNHELGVSGGTENTTYGISGGYFKEGGVMPGQSFERFSLRTSIDTKVSKNIKIGISSLNTLGFTYGSGINPLYNTLSISPLVAPYNTDGSLNLYPRDGTADATATMNPLTLQTNSSNIVDKKRRLSTFNSLYGEVSFLENFKYRANIGLAFRQENYGIYRGPSTILNPSTSLSNATASARNGETLSWTLENLLIYEKTFAQKHKLNFTGLFSAQQDRSFNTRVDGSDFPSEAIQYYNFNLAKTTTVPSDDNNFSKNGIVSFMARVNYSYDDRYLLTATFRRDGSSVFPENKFLSYPAFALAWNISNESFLKDAKSITNLKLRLGYGTTGNQGIPANATRGSLGTNRYNFGATNALGYYVSSLANTGLQWEATTNTNIGVDFGLFSNRLTGSIDLYSQNTNNLLVQQNLAPSSGATFFWNNAAETESKGLEINLSAIPVKLANGFTWTSDFNISFNREKIVRLEDPTKLQDIGNGWFVGQPISVIYDFTKTGIWQTSEAEAAKKFNNTDFSPGRIKIADINNDGVIDANDRSVIGNFQPDYTAGWTNRFNYKNFDLSFVMFARMGNSMVATYLANNGTGTGYFALGSSRPNNFDVNYWTETNGSNDFPKPINGEERINYSSTLGYRDGSFIKLRSINLGYEIAPKMLTKLGLSGARIYLTAQNPAILYSPFVSSGLGFDPEGTGTGGAVPGQAGGGAGNTNGNSRIITVGMNTPSTRSFIFGVNLKF